MNLQLRIVVVDPLDGPPVAAYVGEDPIAADAAYEKAAADEGNEAVQYFVYPSASRRCRPSYEAELRRASEDRAAKDRAAGEEKRQAEIAAARTRLEAAQKHLEQLEGTTDGTVVEAEEAAAPTSPDTPAEPVLVDAIVPPAAGTEAPRHQRKRR